MTRPNAARKIESSPPRATPPKRGGQSALKAALLGEDRDLARSYGAHAPKRDLALALRALRKQASLTQAQVAERSGLAQSHISKMESATGPVPTTESLTRYAEACGAKLCLSFPPKGTRPEDLTGAEGLVCAIF